MRTSGYADNLNLIRTVIEIIIGNDNMRRGKKLGLKVTVEKTINIVATINILQEVNLYYQNL